MVEITHYALRITHYALRITHYALRITIIGEAAYTLTPLTLNENVTSDE